MSARRRLDKTSPTSARKRSLSRPQQKRRRFAFESCEPRHFLSADPLFVGVVYLEDDSGDDAAGDTFELTFVDGAAETELTYIKIDLDHNGVDGVQDGDLFFDTVNSGLGRGNAVDLGDFVKTGDFTVVNSRVEDGTTSLEFWFEDFTADDKLVFTVDVDEANDLGFDPNDPNLGVDRIASGNEFQASLLHATFQAPHFHEVSTSSETPPRFVDDYTLPAVGLELTDDGISDRTAAATVRLQQIPLPISISGTVFHDMDLDLVQDDGDQGLLNWELALWQKMGDDFVDLQITTLTNDQGDYEFGKGLNLLPGTYQVREVQQDDFFSVGAIRGTIHPEPVDEGDLGHPDPNDPNILTEITIRLGDSRAVDYDFAEAQPAAISGFVYHDRNNDGFRDGGETGIPNVEIVVQPVATIAPQTTVTLVTDNDGFYSVAGLAPGTYVVVQPIQPTPWVDGIDREGSQGGIAGNDEITSIFLGGNKFGEEYNFGERMPAMISGFVYHDVDDDGLREDGEQGIGEVPIRIVPLDPNSTQEVLTTETDTNGFYKFNDIAPGKYEIIEDVQPPGFADGTDTPGTVNGDPRGLADNPGDLITMIMLGAEDVGIEYNFGEVKLGEIRGRVHLSTSSEDCFGEQHTQGGIEDVTVLLFNSGDEMIAETKTDADGNYAFTGIRPGTYRVEEVQPEEFADGFERAGTVDLIQVGEVISDDIIAGITLTSGQVSVTNDFCEHPYASISGYVYHDENLNGVRDEGEDPILDVEVQLLDSDGNQVGTSRFTNDAGFYEFTTLVAGSYSVKEIHPEEWLDGSESLGTVTSFDGSAIDSDRGTLPNPDIDEIQIVSLNWGDKGEDYNFGEFLPGSISGFVHVDPDRDCEFEEGEQPIEGVTVSLADENGVVIATTETDENGFYHFDALPPGTYSVLEDQPDGVFHGGQRTGSGSGNDSVADVISAIVVGSDQHLVHYNFCEIPPASISGFVHVDPDRDCEFDEGEQPIAGVTIQLADENGNVVATTETDASGYYQFEDLAPGTYSVVEDQPEGVFHGGQRVGSGTGDDSSADVISQITLLGGEQLVNYNFCEIPPASISGFVHVDPDRDCEFDEGEQPIAGVTIQLADENGNVVATTETDASGYYQFEDLAPGTYSVVEDQPEGVFHGGQRVGSGTGDDSSADVISQITLLGGEQLVNYNFCEIPPASISGFVHVDPDRDCEFDEGEQPIAGVTIQLADENGNVVATTETDASGYYQFEDLAPGTYSVVEDQPEGVFHGGQRVGSGTGDDSSADVISQITLLGGEQLVNYNFCEIPPASISGFVHVDPDRDCEFDEGEQPIAGVTIELADESGNVVATTTTDVNGFYDFNDLGPGSYSVLETQPDGFFHGGQRTGSGSGNDLFVDVISQIEILGGEALVNYNFCEVPPSSISGIVFQDGPVILTPDGLPPEDITAVRDGQLTSDDTRLGGITLELRNGTSGEPILADSALPGHYADGPISTTTDASGFYLFDGLIFGSYAVYEIQPDGFLDSLDTAGTTTGIAVNPSANVAPFVLNQLTEDPHDDAIVRIPLPAGVDSEFNNFSEVLVGQDFVCLDCEFVPPPVDPPVAPEVLTPPVQQPRLQPNVQSVLSPVLNGSGGAVGYTWHLSVVDAGRPRGDEQVTHGDSTVWLTGTSIEPLTWDGNRLRDARWRLARIGNGQPIEIRNELFGILGGIPVTGDFNGDGVDDYGVYYRGEWFLDVDGNGYWDRRDLWAKLGTRDDLPVTGDWDADGKDDIGIFGPAWPGDPRAILAEPGLPDTHNRLTGPFKNLPPLPEEATHGNRLLKLTDQGKTRADLIDHVFHYGTSGDRPVSGDWNGDGIATIGVFREGQWHLDADGDGKFTEADRRAAYGKAGDRPVVGDFNGDGVDEIGVYRGGLWILDANGNLERDAHDLVFTLGNAEDLPVVGDWDGDGTDDVGVYQDAVTSVAAIPE